MGAAKPMMRFRMVWAAVVILALIAPGYADQAKSAYSRGVRAESKRQYDAAFEAYKQAHALKPKDARYLTAYLRVRDSLAADHIRNGQQLRDQLKFTEALAEFQRAAAIDDTNLAAQQEMRRTAIMLKRQSQEPGVAVEAKPESPLTKLAAQVEGPVDLELHSDNPLTLRMTSTADNIYKTIGKLAGLNVLFDLDYKPQRITIELNDVKVREALRMVAMESKTFWRPVSTASIFVAAEGRRKEFEDNVLKTFYVHNASTPAELQEVAGTLKGILDISRAQVNPTHNSITIRGTPDQMVLAEKLLSDMDKPKAEVVIEISVLEVNRDLIRKLGTTVPTSTSISPVGVTTGGGTGSSGPAVKIGSLNGNNFMIPIPGASFTFLMSNSNTKVLQNPKMRVLDNSHATLKIGDRIPIATGSFTPGTFGGANAAVNTQFQYIDVGVNIDITPHIHSDHEVTLKMALEVSSVTGIDTIGGVDQPKIGQRRIEHEARLEDGEINLVGGILEDTETKSLSGYPWLGKLPLLKYLFGQESKERVENEIVFAITPHIVRSEEITDENLRMIDIGTSTTLGLRYKEASPAKPNGATTPSSGNPSKQPHTSQKTGAQVNPPPAPRATPTTASP
jgi:general secretion pathway protein D